MPKKATEPKTPKATKTFAPEIVEARQKCVAMREATEIECKQVVAAARQAVVVRRLTEAMTPEQKEALKASLNGPNFA